MTDKKEGQVVFDQFYIKSNAGDFSAGELIDQIPSVTTTYDLQKDPEKKKETFRLLKSQITPLWVAVSNSSDTGSKLTSAIETSIDDFIKTNGDEEKSGMSRSDVRKHFIWDPLLDESTSMELNQARIDQQVKKIKRIFNILQKVVDDR